LLLVLFLIYPAIQAVTHGIQMSAYTSDMTPPEIAGFRLDLQFDQLALTFNEAVKASTFNFTVVTIKSKCTGGRNFAITGGVFVPVNLPDGVTVITITLLPDDLIAIKSDTLLATDTSNAFLQVDSGTVKKVASQGLLAVTA